MALQITVYNSTNQDFYGYVHAALQKMTNFFIFIHKLKIEELISQILDRIEASEN